ncbi:MAG TPA: hypothetical protein VGK20_07960 [Candidatus Binatia bacterium]
MTPVLRHYLLLEHIAGSAVVNFLLNGLIAWLAFRHLETVPLWGSQSIFGDMVGTTIILPLLTCLIATRIVRWHLRDGRVGSPGWPPESYRVLRSLPDATFARGLVMGLVVTVFTAPLLTGLLVTAGIASLDLHSFLWFKAIYAGALGALVQPLVAMRALADSDAN